VPKAINPPQYWLERCRDADGIALANIAILCYFWRNSSNELMQATQPMLKMVGRNQLQEYFHCICIIIDYDPCIYALWGKVDT